ncbi:MAG: DUF4129 domain-containing protein [Gemmatimonadaceae bacterium]
MLIIRVPSNSAISDTVAAVFRGRDYVLHRSVSLWDIMLRWMAQLVARLFDIASDHPVVGYTVRTALVLALVLMAARLGYFLFLSHRSPGFTLGLHGSSRASDWWETAQRLAAQGDYTAAAHALYLALITAAAVRGLVSLDDSKTTGDYLRELRRSADGAAMTSFADFARSYETVIYGIGVCDADRFARLRALAGSMLGPITGAGA